MSFRTKFMTLMPWIGGTNTSLDPATIKPNELTKAEDLLFSVNGSRNMRPGINFNWDSSTASGGTLGEAIIGVCDYWYGSTGAKTNFLLGIGSSGNLYKWDKISGSRNLIPLSSTASTWNVGSRCSYEVMNNSFVYNTDGVGNYPRVYAPFLTSSASDLQKSSTANTLGAPQMTIMRGISGRLWGNDLNFLDRVNYGAPSDLKTWNGNGDSGALDIGEGDGDPVGVTAIFPRFKGTTYVTKYTKLYSVMGNTPENYQIDTISDGIGCVSHNAVAAIDQDDVVFLSAKGIHSLVGTIQYGDVSEKYLSKDIQRTFNDYWTKALLTKSWAVYLPQINSVGFAVPDSQFSGSGNTAIWLYNFTLKAWYVWPRMDCQSITVSQDTDQQRFYIGTGTGRLGKTFSGDNFDTDVTGTQSAITMTIKTGVIFMENNPMIVNAFKRFTLIWGPQGIVQVTTTLKIDNYSPQALSFSLSGGNSTLGVNFILGASPLGGSQVTGPSSQTIDGYGRSIQITITQTGRQAAVNIQGISVEYEPLGPAQETITSG